MMLLVVDERCRVQGRLRIEGLRLYGSSPLLDLHTEHTSETPSPKSWDLEKAAQHCKGSSAGPS